MKDKENKRKKVKDTTIDMLFLLAACCFGTFSTVSIMLPNGLTSGGLTGIVRIIQNYVNLNFSVIYYMASIAILIILTIFLGWKEARKTIILSIMYPTVMMVFEKLNLSQESLELLMDLALEMSQKQKAAYEKDEEAKYQDSVVNFNKLFNEDSELPSANSMQLRKYMELANSAYSEFTSPKLKEILEKSGLVYHPELIKMFHKIGELSQEDNLSHCGKPAIEELTPAQILYGNT